MQVKKLNLLFFYQLLPLLSFAQDYKIQEPVFGGTGCPNGSIPIAVSSDRKKLHFNWNRFSVETKDGTTIDRKTCNLSIPVSVSPKTSIALAPVEYQGYLSLVQGSSVVFTAETFFSGLQGRTYKKTFPNSSSQKYAIRFPEIAEDLAWSPCGQDTIVRLNFSVLLTSPNGKTAVSIDSMDDPVILTKSCQ